ncbi:uncharacterized protein LOC142362970 [Opisthocomus hoazin]|uniref:uncharacterized protein LOC142362970 n=1 Tax=Opisthocomus hoazin TaxID=30419 RepID=UPI003F53C343
MEAGGELAPEPAGCPAETGLTRAPLKLCKCNSLFQTEWECRRPSTSVLAPAAGWFARCGATRGAAPVAWLTQPGHGSGSCFCETVQTDGLDAPVLWLGLLHEQGAGTGRTPGPSPPSPVGVRGTPGGKHPPEGFIETYSAPRVPPHPAFKAASLKCESLQYLVLKECWALLPFPSARACLVQLVKEERRSASERCRDRVAASPVILSRTKTLLEHRRALNAKAQSRRHLGKGALPLPGTAESRNPKRVLHRENHLGKLVGSDGEKKCQGDRFEVQQKHQGLGAPLLLRSLPLRVSARNSKALLRNSEGKMLSWVLLEEVPLGGGRAPGCVCHWYRRRGSCAWRALDQPGLPLCLLFPFPLGRPSRCGVVSWWH